MQEHEGLIRMQAEMARQCSDALATMAEAGDAARVAADSIRATGGVTLCAMGGSHHVNAIAAPLYRDLGYDSLAWTASELLLSPVPRGARTVLIASQSGRSGEIVQYVEREAPDEQRFALTLDPDSPLARICRAALVAHGGPEQAFAATRSIILTLAMHGAILDALGTSQPAMRAVFEADRSPSISAAEEALAGCDTLIFAGYGAMAGVAGSAALSMMELARVPTIAFDGGQFRHGPFEVLRPGIGVVLFRSAGAEAPLVPPLAAAALDAGCSTIVVDASGRTPIPGCVTVDLPNNEGLGAAAAMLLAMQPLNIAVARRRIKENVGTPLRTSKITV